MKEVNLEKIIDTQSWYKIWELDGFKFICAKPKLLRRRKGVYESFSSRRKSRKSFLQTVLWNLDKLVKIYPGIIERPHTIDPRQNGMAGRAVRWIKEGTSAVLLQSGNHKRQVGPAGTSRIPIRCWNLSVHDRTTFLTLLLVRKKSWEMQQDQKQPQRQNWRENHTRHLKEPSEVCIELPLDWEGRRRHPCESGCRLGWRPEDKVLYEWRCVGNRSVLHCSTLVCDTGNCIAFLSFIKGKGDDKRLHWSVVCETSVSVSDCETTQNCVLDRQQQRQGHHCSVVDQGAEQKHSEVQTLWAHQLVKISLISLSRESTLESCADILTKHVPRAVLDKLAGMMGYTIHGEESVNFQTYTCIIKNFWDQKVAAIMKLLLFNNKKTS